MRCALLALITRTSRGLCRAPLGFGAREWLFSVAFAAAVVVLFSEKRALAALTGIHEPTLATSIITALGGGAATTIWVLALLTFGRLRGDPRLTRAGVVLGSGGACAYALTSLGQFVLAEARPIDGGEMHLFASGGHGVSGHAAAASFLALALSRTLARDLAPARERALTIAVFAWAAIVAGSRIYLGMHFAWNVLLGVGIGLSVATVAEKEKR